MTGKYLSDDLLPIGTRSGECMNDTNVLPCPFCGSHAILVRGDAGADFVECQKCEVLMTAVGGLSAEELWNARSKDTDG